jgi:hypothetical protein
MKVVSEKYSTSGLASDITVFPTATAIFAPMAGMF